MQAQTLEQIKAATPPSESLWHFIARIPESMEAQIFVMLLVAGLLGMIANYAVKWARSEIAGSLHKYLFETNVRGTMLSLFSYIGLMVTSIVGGIFTGDQGGFVGWTNVLWFGLTNGFAVDAIANKGERPIWTDEQRSKANAASTAAPAETAVLPVTGEKQS